MKKRKVEAELNLSEYVFPDLVLFEIFSFLDNETLWCNILLVCKHFNYLLYDDVKNGLILSNCDICQHLIQIRVAYYNSEKWTSLWMSSMEHEKEEKKIKASIEKLKLEHIENIKINGLKKAIDTSNNDYSFVCSKHFNKCDKCKINYAKDDNIFPVNQCSYYENNENMESFCLNFWCYNCLSECGCCKEMVCDDHIKNRSKNCDACFKIY